MTAIDPRKTAVLVAALLLAAVPALARQSDRNQPMDIEAGAAEHSVDGSTPTVLSGGVTITQGTLRARADRAEVTVLGGDPSRVVLIGSPATLRQQMDDGTLMDATATRMDYDVTREVMVLTGNVRIEQPRGTLAGERVVYNMLTGQVTSGGEDSGRVRMRIMPRNATQPAAEDPAAKAGTDADEPGQEPR